MENDNLQLEGAHSVITPEVAHKMSEFVTTLYGNLEMLGQQSLDARGRRQLERADEAIHQLWQLIGKISVPLVP